MTGGLGRRCITELDSQHPARPGTLGDSRTPPHIRHSLGGNTTRPPPLCRRNPRVRGGPGHSVTQSQGFDHLLGTSVYEASYTKCNRGKEHGSAMKEVTVRARKGQTLSGLSKMAGEHH